MKEFKPGFRLSKPDVLILILGVLVSCWLYRIAIDASLVVVFVIGHFFLFCNVFRFSRAPELIWSAVFVTLVGLSQKFYTMSILYIFAVQVFVTILLIVLELRKQSYHGGFLAKSKSKFKVLVQVPKHITKRSRGTVNAWRVWLKSWQLCLWW
ncbi:hypothetical protein [Vibrio parahaemolyticus]|uniref:hypothetical protein n=1 Tax=Vibrio parahaemolyticus TaxID=670 RepID=UPI00112138B1|nr:hypothetical protein [Vibrio parahaemolyticus]MBE3844884.1 hypothetical protein [Vibrio parahaemolyticus]MBE3945864.1 hypothetical protein [Vibrio parahaemolyticus]MBE4120933.1 hypothetical protein [Vibrio parahaemolyticus]MBE4781706.1 hypothetical protein [Vibrio parahaemolyticus]MEA5290717.1 hypothetical protein [Vibrio parahaemolyticus]